jgi:hypothetical protein
MFQGFDNEEAWKEALQEQREHLKKTYDFDLLDEARIDVASMNDAAKEASAFMKGMAGALRAGIKHDDGKVVATNSIFACWKASKPGWLTICLPRQKLWQRRRGLERIHRRACSEHLACRANLAAERVAAALRERLHQTIEFGESVAFQRGP